MQNKALDRLYRTTKASRVRMRVQMVLLAVEPGLKVTQYEYLPESSETIIYLAMSRLRLRRLARQAPDGVPSQQRQRLRGLGRAFLNSL